MVKPAHSNYADRIVRLLMWELEHEGFTPTDMADEVGGAARTFENYKYGASPSLASFVGLIRMGRPKSFAKEIAKICGGYFVHLNGLRCDVTQITRQTSEVMREAADVLTAVSRALKDDKISNAERLAIKKELDEAIEALLKLKIVIEEK